jgi:hypothetical protein
MTLVALIRFVLQAEPAWVEVERDDGVVIEARDVEGSVHRELRATTTVKLPVEALCDAAFGPKGFDASEPSLKSRRVLREAADEQVHYDQMSAPIVADRDIVVRDRRERLPSGACRVSVDAVKDDAVPPREDHVRIEGMRSSWLFEPKANGETSVTHTVWTDPKVSMPVAFVEPSRRKNAVTWVKLVLERARAASAPARAR